MSAAAFSRSARLKGKAASLLVIGVCIVLSSCNPKTTWSVEVPSPDGSWIASARTDQYSGPGNAGLYTGVYLRRTRGQKDPMEILLLDQQETGPITVKMNWLTPSHLEVTYTDNPTVDFQAVKAAGIEISVRELSSEIIKTSQ
ncbi:MAG: hypothetical protein WBE44_22925 [Terriglobales bacterium]|jgi:hypothetical protein